MRRSFFCLNKGYQMKFVYLCLIAFLYSNVSHAGSGPLPNYGYVKGDESGSDEELVVSGIIKKLECATAPSGWDWNDLTSQNWRDYHGGQIQTPWSTSNHFGMDLSVTKLCPEDGWALYDKKMTCSDWFEGGCDPSTPVTSERTTPYFSLYNIYTGQLRSFFLLGGSNLPENKVLIRLSVKEGKSVSTYSAFLNHFDRVQPYKRDVPDTSYPINTLHSWSNGWAVVEHLISYNPNVPNDNTNFQFEIYGLTESQIKLGGDFSFTIDRDDIENSPEHSISSVWGSLKDAGKAYKDPVSWAKDAEKEAIKLKNKGSEESSTAYVELGEKLSNIASTISAGSGVLGAINAGASLYNAFTGGSTIQFQTLYGDGKLTLDGTISNKYPKLFLTHGFLNAGQLVVEDYPDIDYVGRLGLFHFTDLPKVRYTSSTWSLTTKNLREIIKVNPNSMMELVGYRVAPVIIGGPHDLLESDERLITISDSQTTMDSLVKPDSIKRLTGMGSCTHFPESIMCFNLIRDTKLKVYLLFRHTHRPDIYLEVMRTLDTIATGEKTSTRSRF